MAPRVRQEDHGPVRVLVLENASKRNALDFQALEELEDACARATSDAVPYVGLSIAFSFAIAALIEGRTDAAWAGGGTAAGSVDAGAAGSTVVDSRVVVRS